MKWVTRERPRIDRVACAWLIKRFLDPAAEFFFVPADQVHIVAEREGATAFHVRGGTLERSAEEDRFDALLRVYQVGQDDPALQRLARIVRGADIAGAEPLPESAGVRAIMNGYIDVFTDDHQLLGTAVTVYEALYQWCRRHP